MGAILPDGCMTLRNPHRTALVSHSQTSSWTATGLQNYQNIATAIMKFSGRRPSIDLRSHNAVKSTTLIIALETVIPTRNKCSLIS